MRLGIDFGTTRTVVACADRGNYPVLGFLDEAGDAHDFVPSVVAERDGELRFGWDAVAAAAHPSFTAVRSFKRLLADADAGPGKSVRVGATSIALDELVTRFLAHLREAVVTRSTIATETGGSLDSGALRAVVAVPANASGAQRFVTLECFRRAGFAPIAMLNEPSAAGFEYTHRHRDTLSAKREQVVVFDLGGGTFDASLVRMRGRSHEVLATAGVNHLGGDDFDAALVDLVVERAGVDRAALGARALGRLVEQCREAKERLTASSRKVAIDLELALGDAAPRPDLSIPVGDLYAACAPLVARAIDAMEAVIGGGLDEVAGIYVVGGASELPIVARALRERFGRRVHRSPYPSAAIAIGLAIACDEGSGYELADRYARTFGVFREGQAGAEIVFDPIFTGDTTLPAPGAPVRRRRRYRAAHNVGHFRFLECNAVADDGRPRGDMTVSGDVLFPFAPDLGGAADLTAVAVERLGPAEGPVIEEEYALDDAGIVAVTIKNVDAGVERVYRLGATG